ncbi:Asp-tRNA(Asn)/Glu-tRNA(Gln) amidotransferase GatCAB subunit B [Henriciella mobilis]|uniref:Asp-tRNA(Asn)/Glu-tRNA(Gln) amidotransferase subunit GatB n=1 Tax=Henriciella mobilis TaxID=2305467 RepID=UPI000E6686EB|nr:Asp-tRNA(Asn)/Glu-tRNA(Gln) amidotransferase subunit GatB [Henriciella mobilis]RIJ15648.1 Asp-tRNA(Asn)/Glu-tRNA(Gln) amidotransferase GatCAB subunit B [Henriciella mobilis]RIJ19112.1 Asp-tRNA(Asn)/Glu-tRNA(Gln) amidotransferase GatCAB subunit B [Henriciella mobilis]
MTERPTYTLKGETGDWELVMGLEVHAQVASEAKLFSGASTKFGADPNCNVSLVDAAMPGMLPVINRKCVEQAVRTGLGLKAKINKWSRFDRKNYFYPDLPQGYQISQFDHPIVGEGEIEVDVEPAHGDPAYSFPVRIERLHLEQDAGKSIHDMDPTATYVDLNRSGVALMEIVSKPDVRTPLEAAAYVKKLKSIVVALGTCDGDMEKGNLRADVNVSVCKPGAYEKFRETGDFSHLGTRCEIKNMNSFRFIQAAIEYEARRQIEILESGGKVDQETRLFDPNKGETRSMRSKEDAHDYRYFPDPDLLPLEIDDLFIDNIRESLPELPDEKRQRFQDEYGLSRYDAGVLTADSERAEFFEAVAHGRDAKLAANWVSQELFGYLNREDLELADSPVSSVQLGELIDLISNDTISGKIAKDVFARMIDGEGDPVAIVEKHGLKQVTDTGAIEAIVDEIIAANPEQAESVKEKPKAMGWFVGQVMKASGGKANPQAVNQILRQKLGL